MARFSKVTIASPLAFIMPGFCEGSLQNIATSFPSSSVLSMGSQIKPPGALLKTKFSIEPVTCLLIDTFLDLDK